MNRGPQFPQKWKDITIKMAGRSCTYDIMALAYFTAKYDMINTVRHKRDKHTPMYVIAANAVETSEGSAVGFRSCITVKL